MWQTVSCVEIHILWLCSTNFINSDLSWISFFCSQKASTNSAARLTRYSLIWPWLHYFCSSQYHRIWWNFQARNSTNLPIECMLNSRFPVSLQQLWLSLNSLHDAQLMSSKLNRLKKDRLQCFLLWSHQRIAGRPDKLFWQRLYGLRHPCPSRIRQSDSSCIIKA